MLTTFTIYISFGEGNDCGVGYQIKRSTPFFLRPGDSLTLIEACGFSIEVERSTYNVDEDTVYVDIKEKRVSTKERLLSLHRQMVDSGWRVLECSPGLENDID